MANDNQENIDILVRKLFDPACMTVACTPVFYVNSHGEWRVIDQSSIDGLISADKNHHDIITEIDSSCITGIQYALRNTLNPSPIESVLDLILSSWRINIPSRINTTNYDYGKQLILSQHEEDLCSLDDYFASTIIECKEKHGQENLQEHVLQQLKSVLDDNTIYDKFWGYLLADDRIFAERVISEDNLRVLLAAYIDKLAQNNWLKLGDNGLFINHLQQRRALQNELRTTAEGSLKTDISSDGSIHILAINEVRDLVNRAAYIDTSLVEDASDLRDICLAAILRFYDGTLSRRLIMRKIEERDSIRACLTENKQAARLNNSLYQPTLEEIQANLLQDVDDFIKNEFLSGDKLFLIKIQNKLNKYIQGDNLNLTSSQINVLQDLKLPEILANSARIQSELFAADIIGAKSGRANFSLYPDAQLPLKKKVCLQLDDNLIKSRKL